MSNNTPSTGTPADANKTAVAETIESFLLDPIHNSPRPEFVDCTYLIDVSLFIQYSIYFCSSLQSVMDN